MLPRSWCHPSGRINQSEFCLLESTEHSYHFFTRFIASENTTADQAYFDALAADKDLGQTRGIDATLKMFNLDTLILPTSGAAGPAAIAGYPIVTGDFF